MQKKIITSSFYKELIVDIENELTFGLLAAKKALIEEMGKAAAKVWIIDAGNIKHLSRIRRMLVVARKS